MILNRLFWTGYIAYHALGQGRYPFKPIAAVVRDQSRRVRAMADYAYRYVPYYRETMDRLGLTSADIRGADDLAKLPIIEVEHIQRDPEYYISRELPRDRYIKISSSGSSGTPHSIWRDERSFCLGAAPSVRERRALATALGGRPPRKGTVIVPVPSSALQNLQFHYGHVLLPQFLRLWRQVLPMTDPLERNVQRINEFRPDALAAYGSYLDMLFRWLQETGTPLQRPRVILFSADAIGEATRRLIEEEYGIPVFSLYQTVEANRFGFECECHKGHHMNIDLYPLRIIDGAGRTLPAGESGQVVVSNLLNRGMVLLNYRIKDVASFVPEACPCGRSLPLLSLAIGRTEDVIELPSGGVMHPVALVGIFRGMDDVREYQIVQKTPDQFEVRLVVEDPGRREGLRARLAPRFHKALGDGVRVDFQFVDTIAALPSGKRPVVLSLCKQARPQE